VTIFSFCIARAQMQGLVLNVNARRRGFCIYVPAINDNLPTPQFCVFDGQLTPVIGVRVRVKVGHCAPQFSVTGTLGCAPITIGTNCHNPATNSLLISGSVVPQQGALPTIARLLCDSTFLR
jgi:hypothetical protein